jgi:four helix bundle protein
MANFRNLKVWRKSHELSLRVSKAAIKMRGRALGDIRSQLTKAAESIPSNIVEGSSMKGDREYARFIGYSIGSSNELENHLITARDKQLLSLTQYHGLLARLIEVRKMLYGLLRALKNPPPPPTPKRRDSAEDQGKTS